MVLPERIKQARELAGMSKTELAERLGVTVSAVSQWETNSKHPTIDNELSLSKALDVPMMFFSNAIPAESLHRGPITFRARSSARTMILKRQAQRFSEIVSELFIWLEKHIAFPAPILPEVSASNPEDAATQCRRSWGLGDLPITKLGELLESKGIRLCTASFGNIRFDAYSCSFSGRPFIFLGTEKQDRARSRFDAAHELGHLLLHQTLSDDELLSNYQKIESEANEFAGAFLMPAETFSRDVMDTTLEGFKRLKPRWGVAIQAMVHRARDLKLITQETYERHFRNMSAYGWRRAKAEPLDEIIPTVNRSLGKKSLALLCTNKNFKPWELPSELPLPESIFVSVFDTDAKTFMFDEQNKVIAINDFLVQRKA
ncbi:MAG: XRE family transcriptional regulator [Verrucomicrobiia bacterium]